MQSLNRLKSNRPRRAYDFYETGSREIDQDNKFWILISVLMDRCIGFRITSLKEILVCSVNDLKPTRQE